MTTTVNFYSPYIMGGKVIRVRVTNPTGGVLTEKILAKPNEVHSLVIHDGGQLELAEIDTPAEESVDG